MSINRLIPIRWKSWLDAGLNLFYPPVCQICRNERAAAGEGYVCSACWSRQGGVRFIESPICDRCGIPVAGDVTNPFACSNCREMELHFRSARSAVIATELILDVIHRYKYKRALWFEPFMGNLLVRQASPLVRGGHWDLIVPVPLHPVKLREREFNQAERLGLRLAQATGLPIRRNLLRRLRPTATQTMLSRKDRAANVQRAFDLRPGASLSGENILLIDDVFTTGATTNACARVLKQAGAGEIQVWTLARGL